MAAGSCGKSANNLNCSASCDCTCHLPDLECGCMNPACKVAGSCFHEENGEQVLNEGCNCSVHAKKPLIEILNEVIDHVALDGSRGVIGVVTKGNALATIASLLSLRIVVPELVLGANINLRDLGAEVSVAMYRENAAVFELGIDVGDLVIEFAPRAILKNTSDYRDWKTLTVGVSMDADITFAMDGVYAETLTNYIAENVEGDSMKIVVGNNTAQDKVELALGLEIAANVALNGLVRPDVELWLSFYAKTGEGELYNSGSNLISLYYNSNEETGGVRQEVLYIAGSAYGAENAVKLTNVGLYDVVMNLIDNISGGKVSAAGEEDPSAQAVNGLISGVIRLLVSEENGLLISTDGGALQLALALINEDLGALFPPTDGVRVSVGEDGLSVSLVFNENSKLTVEIADAELFFDKSFAQVDSLRDKIVGSDGIVTNASPMSEAGAFRLKGEISVEANTGVTTDENGNPVEEYVASTEGGYLGALNFLLKSDAAHHVNYSVSADVSVSGLNTDDLRLTGFNMDAVKDLIGKALEGVKLQATLIVRDHNDQDENGNDKVVLAVYYTFDQKDTVYIVVPAFDLRLKMEDVLPLESILERLIGKRTDEGVSAAEDEGSSVGGFAVKDILKLVDKIALSNEKLAIDLSSQILSRVLLMAGIEITLPEIYTTVTLGKLAAADGTVGNGLGIKVVSALIPQFNADIRLGDLDIYMEQDASDLLAPVADVFGRMDTYSTIDSLQAKVEFEADLSYGLGENQSNADGNAWAFESLLNGLNVGIGIIDSLKGHYKLTVSATVNIAEGFESLYGLEIYIVLYSVTERENGTEAYNKQFSVYYGKGVLGLNFEPLLGVEPFELELDLGAMISGGGVASAEEGEGGESASQGIDIVRIIESLSGVIKLYVKEKSAVLNLSGTVLHTALVALGYDNYFPITAEGVTNLNTEKANALAEGDYTVFVTYDDHDSESFVYHHTYLRELLFVDLKDCEVSAIRYEGQGRSGVFYNETEWSALFDLNAAAGTITWAKGAAFEALPLGSYDITVVKTGGKASSAFKMEKKISSYTYKNGLHLTGHAVQQIEIKKGDALLKTLVPTADQLSGEKELIGDYFAINAYGGLIDLEFGEGIRAKVRLKDDTYLQISLTDIAIDMAGGTVERKDKNGEVENYTDNIKSVYLDFSVDLAAFAAQGYKLDLDETIGGMLEGVLGGLFEGRDINFYAEKAIELNYRLDVQASVKIQGKTIDLAHSEFAVTIVDPHDRNDDYDDEEVLTVYYVGTQTPGGALYVSVPLFDLKLKVDEIDFVKKINEISPFVEKDDVSAAEEGEVKAPTVAETIASILLGVNLYDTYLDDSAPYSAGRFYGIQALFAEQAFNVLLKLAGFSRFTLPELKDSTLSLYIDKNESKFIEAYLEFNTTKVSSVTLTINQPEISLNKKMNYKNNLGTFVSISEAGSLTLDLSASFTVDSDKENNINVSSLVNLLVNGAENDSLIVKTDRSTAVYTFTASLNFSLQGVTESLFGDEEGGLSLNQMLRSMLKNLYAHVTVDRAVDGNEARLVEAYFYNNCLYLDLSSIGLPKAALPMNLADLVPDDEEGPAAAEESVLSCGCNNETCLAHASNIHDPTHPCRDEYGIPYSGCRCRYCDPEYDDSFNIYYTARGILAKMETEMFAAALNALGIDATLDVSLNARLHMDEGFSATVVFHGVDDTAAPAHTSVTLAIAKPKIVLGGVIEQMLEDTSDFGYLNNLENISVEFTIELKSLINKTSTAGRYNLDGFIADLFSYGIGAGGRPGLPVTLTDDIVGNMVLYVAANLDLRDVNRSEILLRVYNRKDGQEDEWITIFYGGEYDLIVYLPIVDEKFNMTFNVNLAKFLGEDTTDMIQNLPKTVSDAIYGAIGVNSVAAAGEESESSGGIIGLAFSVIDNLYFASTGKIALNTIGKVVEKFSEYMLGSTVTLGDMQYLQLYADLLKKDIGIETKIKNGSEAPENSFSIAIKDYSFRLVKKTIDFDKSQYNTLEDYEFLYVKAAGKIEYDLPDGVYDFGGLIKSIVDAAEIPVSFEG
ncbi:MAG TPA: hypothetical protein DCG79_05210, partial [Clostridiales bacterium]|nr:hypothetical protein [Clostridiales bacterium]